jgi:hypothetical protein
VGCAGRYFTAEFVPNVRMFFRYGSQDAYLLVGSDLYFLGEPPVRTDGGLTWSTTSAGHQIQIQVNCSPPPDTGALAVAERTSACSLLTRAIAGQVLHGSVSQPKFVQENPELSYCDYTSRAKSFNGRREVMAYAGSAGVIEQLSSWHAPTIPGLGDKAHGGDASEGLAIRKGKLGLEITVDLGFSASNAQDLAAEKALARRLLARLPG